jgi:hypothetical protein
VLRVLGRKADHAESVTRLVRFVLEGVPNP